MSWRRLWINRDLRQQLFWTMFLNWFWKQAGPVVGFDFGADVDVDVEYFLDVAARA